jgi:hypothetical protein
VPASGSPLTVRPARSPRRPSRLLAGLAATAAAACLAPTVVAATPLPTPSLAPPAQARTVGGVTFTLNPYTFGAWPNPLGYFQAMTGPVPLHPIGRITQTQRDATGVRIVVRGRHVYNMPVAQAQDGMGWLARFRSDGTPAALTLAKREGYRLIATHRTSPATGTAWWFPYPFAFREYGETAYLNRPPWYSGMAQGEVTDLFTQLYAITHAPVWRHAAQHACASFLSPLRTGESARRRPWVDRAIGRSLWIEEFPLPHPNDNTINGFGFALIGLADYARTFGGAQARLVADGGLTTWIHAIPKVRQPGGVMGYSFSHPGDLSKGYHQIVTTQLSFLGGITGNAEYNAMSAVLYADFH